MDLWVNLLTMCVEKVIGIELLRPFPKLCHRWDYHRETMYYCFYKEYRDKNIKALGRNIFRIRNEGKKIKHMLLSLHSSRGPFAYNRSYNPAHFLDKTFLFYCFVFHAPMPALPPYGSLAIITTYSSQVPFELEGWTLIFGCFKCSLCFSYPSFQKCKRIMTNQFLHVFFFQIFI